MIFQSRHAQHGGGFTRDRSGDFIHQIHHIIELQAVTQPRFVKLCGLMIALGKKLGLDEQELRRVGMGGLLHDVGKAAVPLAILNKAGKLTEEEFRVMREHPVVGRPPDAHASP